MHNKCNTCGFVFGDEPPSDHKCIRIGHIDVEIADIEDYDLSNYLHAAADFLEKLLRKEGYSSNFCDYYTE